MKEELNRKFDLNRNLNRVLNSESVQENMANQQELAMLLQSIQQQQSEIQQLREQLNQQRAAQEQIIQQNQHQHAGVNNNNNNNRFQLTPDQVLSHFRRLKSFEGKDDYTLMEFIRSVESAVELCHNDDFRQYALRIVLNEKILGQAKRCVQRLGDNLTWETAKAELKLHFRPRKDYSELINECRNVKVGNLRELFEIVKSVNYQLNELYNFENVEDRPINHSPENNDRYLVGIVMEKMDNLVRGNVQKNSTLIEIYNRFAELKLLDDERAIGLAHRKIRNVSKNNNRENYRPINRQINKPNNNDETHKRQYNNNSHYYFNPNNNYRPENNRNDNGNNILNRNNSPNNNSNNNLLRRNLDYSSGRFNTSNRSRNNFNNSNNVEPMEVENVQQQNFPVEPQEVNYP